MKVGVVGLGLIGGSFAKAYHTAGHTVYAREVDESVLGFAKLLEVVDDDLNKENISECDIVFICLYPEAAVEFLNDYGPSIGKKPIIIDCCGTKREIVEAGSRAATEYGFTYLGGHPMAGRQYSGFKYSTADMYVNAPMVLVPMTYDNIELLDRVKELLKPAGFARISVTTAKKHDEIIAFTSQLAHVVSSAYIKSPTALLHDGFSAGSYKDMTRVAWLNPEMWAELFLDNKDFLSKEIEILINNLKDYKDAIDNSDKETLTELLREGKIRKEQVDSGNE